jgi:large subunit ribosomal protein L17
MRHRNKTSKLKRTASHRRALLANLSCSLIEHGRIKTTLGKAKALRPVVEKLVTLAKRDDLHSRRLAIAFLHDKEIVKKLFAEVAPAAKNRQGGYTRITKLGARMSDSAPMGYIEWVDLPGAVEEVEEAAPAPATKTKAKAKKTAVAVEEAPAAEEAAPAEEVAAEEAPAEEPAAEEAAEPEEKPAS